MGIELSEPTDSFILGSGPSILSLTEREKECLNSSSKTLALNQYLIYWHLVGVLPRLSFLTDNKFPATDIVISEVLKVIDQLERQITLYVYERSLDNFKQPTTLRDLLRSIGIRIGVLRKYRYWLPMRLDQSHIRTFKSIQDTPMKFNPAARFARSLGEPLYWFRGSLTTAINLMAILFPGSDIKLLGVDLNVYQPFYDQAWQSHPVYRVSMDNVPDFHREAKKRNMHSTAIPTKYPSILTAIPRIRSWLEPLGSQLFCCNRESLLVTEGLCPYKAVTD